MVTLAQVWETQTYPFSWPRRRRHHVRADGFHLLAVQSSLWFGRSMTFSKRTRWVICERWFLSGDWTWILPSTTWNLKLIFGTTVLVDPTETLRAYKLERGRSLVVENPRPSTGTVTFCGVRPALEVSSIEGYGAKLVRKNLYAHSEDYAWRQPASNHLHWQRWNCLARWARLFLSYC